MCVITLLFSMLCPLHSPARKSVRQSTSEHTRKTNLRLQERQDAPRRRRGAHRDRPLTQEELLAEAEVTAELNIRSLGKSTLEEITSFPFTSQGTCVLSNSSSLSIKDIWVLDVNLFMHLFSSMVTAQSCFFHHLTTQRKKEFTVKVKTSVVPPMPRRSLCVSSCCRKL